MTFCQLYAATIAGRISSCQRHTCIAPLGLTAQRRTVTRLRRGLTLHPGQWPPGNNIPTPAQHLTGPLPPPPRRPRRIKSAGERERENDGRFQVKSAPGRVTLFAPLCLVVNGMCICPRLIAIPPRGESHIEIIFAPAAETISPRSVRDGKLNISLERAPGAQSLRAITTEMKRRLRLTQ